MIDTSKPMQVSAYEVSYDVLEFIESRELISVKYGTPEHHALAIFSKTTGEHNFDTVQGKSCLTLSNAPPKKVERKGWFNHYRDFTWGPYDTKEQADVEADEADFEEGQHRLDCTEVDLSFYPK